MTAYALLTYSLNDKINDAVQIAKWIIAQRNPNGGFSSTQVVTSCYCYKVEDYEISSVFL